jgi:hypothetical protein
MARRQQGTLWSQGSFIELHDAVKLGLIQENDSNKIAIVISHSCDLARPPETEPNVEIIVGSLISALDGNCTYSKNPRKLHLTATSSTGDVYFELLATDKKAVSKQNLMAIQPCGSRELPPKELRTLQRWLAARYYRAAFPDEFNERLKEAGLDSKLVKILKPLGNHIVAILFDVDAGNNIERSSPQDIYTLAIYLLYSTETDPQAAELAAQDAADSISKAFRDKLFDSDEGVWNVIELTYCEAVADQAMPYAMAQSLAKWNMDHLSLRTEPAQPILSD